LAGAVEQPQMVRPYYHRVTTGFGLQCTFDAPERMIRNGRTKHRCADRCSCPSYE
jgi:hypothetical protein